MARVTANGIEIEYDTFGQADARPLLMIMGFGAQMTAWEEEFCGQLADEDHYVIRFDNRDVGLSSSLDHLGVPDMQEMLTSMLAGEQPTVPYGLGDMAADAAGLLDALAISDAHICGASMGGMIAQVFAHNHPDKTRSLTSIMSSTGNPSLPQSTDEAREALMSERADEKEAAAARAVEVSKIIGSPGFPRDESRIRQRALASFERSFNPDGVARQMAAIATDGDRRDRLRSVKVPALVIHGKSDPLVPVEGGIDTHESLSDSELLLIEGMGHDLPREAWPEIVAAISMLTRRAH